MAAQIPVREQRNERMRSPQCLLKTFGELRRACQEDGHAQMFAYGHERVEHLPVGQFLRHRVTGATSNCAQNPS